MVVIVTVLLSASKIKSSSLADNFVVVVALAVDFVVVVVDVAVAVDVFVVVVEVVVVGEVFVVFVIFVFIIFSFLYFKFFEHLLLFS